MPSSLTRVLPFALVSSTRLPVSVCGTVNGFERDMLFSVQGAFHFLPFGTASRPLTACHLNPLRGWNFPKRHITPTAGTGILTCCPSPTLFSLGLGPANPTRTDLPSETLDVRRTWFSHVFRYSYLHSHFYLLQRPSQDAFFGSRTLPYHDFSSPISVECLSPVTLSAQARSTSELLRTLSRVAASKPTSWLSLHAHIVFHLAFTLGP